MNSIYERETEMWKAAVNNDSDAFFRTVSEAAVMICGGYRCSGAEYAEFLKDFGITGFSVSNFETVFESETAVQIHYIARTEADSPDLQGAFHVTSSWLNRDGEWKLVFNMDSRIQE